MENKKISSFPFIFIFVATICFVLILGWSFGYRSGYGLITLWSNFGFCISAIFQIISLIVLLGLFVFSIWGWAFSLGKAGELKIGKWGMKSICEFLYTIFVCLAFIVFLFAAIGLGGVTIGMVLYLIACLGSFVAYLVFRSKGLIDKNGIISEVENFGEQNEKTVVKKSKKNDNENN